MKLLVTGGSGFIGSNFIHYWLNTYQNDTVVNLDALTYAGNPENLTDIETDARYRFVRGSITDVDLVRELVSGIDCVVHFAAESHVDRSIMDPDAFVQTNIVGTHVLLKACLDAGGRRFHHISTDEVFGALPLDSKDRFSEMTPYDPRSPYSASKAASDHLIRAYYHTYSLPVTITNCSNNYGPYQFPEKFIPLAIINLLEGKKIPLYGDGQHVRDWLYVEDHCRALDKVIHDGKVGDTYCIGGDGEMKNIDVLRHIIRDMGKDESVISFVKDRPGHDRRYAIDYSKIRKELGWKPEHSFDTWIRSTIEWYTSHTSWWKNITSGAYRTYYSRQYPDHT